MCPLNMTCTATSLYIDEDMKSDRQWAIMTSVSVGQTVIHTEVTFEVHGVYGKS